MDQILMNVLILLTWLNFRTIADLTVQLDPFGSNSIRVRVAVPKQKIQEPIISALLPTPPPFKTKVTHGSLNSLTNGNLKIDMDITTGFLTATRLSDKKILLQQSGLQFNGPSAGSRAGSASVVVTFAGTVGESFTGFGEHGRGNEGHGVRRFEWAHIFADSLFYGKSQGADVSIPYYSSSLGYGFLWNLPSLGSVSASGRDKNPHIQWISNATLCIDMWITTTPGNLMTGMNSFYSDLLKQYVDATGHALPMPSWTTGFIQCKDRYRNQTQLLDVARGYKSRGLPISMIVIDWFHWKNMGDWQLNPVCWPDPQGMVDELRKMDIELMITFWPYVGQNVSTHWEEYKTKGWLALNMTDNKPDSFWRYRTPTGNSLVDSTNPNGMNATFQHWYEGYGKYGVRALWMDEAEPDHAAYISGGQWRLHKGTDAELLPAWVADWTTGFKNGFGSIGAGPGEFFVLSRNAWAGTQRNGMGLWSGDIGSNWGELQSAVSIGQGVGMSGLPLWTTDIGGYGGGDPSSPDFQELIVRWFQFGAFCPLFRLHGHRRGGPPEDQCGPTNGDNEVWNLAKEKGHYNAIVAVMNLREKLRTYVKNINDESVTSGIPMMRPMFLQFPHDAVCTAMEDNNGACENQYMFGSDWLISPVTQSNAASWPVYLPSLPSGQVWIYWWNQTACSPGHKTVTINSLKDFPLFKRQSNNSPFRHN